MRTDIDFAAHMETVALALRGQPSSKHGAEWRYGTNGSLSIDIKRGTFFNHETKIGGGVVELIKSEKPGTDVFDYLRSLGCIEKSRPGNGANNDPFDGVTLKNNSKQFRVVRIWPYTDETGEALFEVCRTENGEKLPNGKAVKKYFQRHKGANGIYINSVKDIRPVPYRLPELIEAVATNKLIFITEGEKCADAVGEPGASVTTNAGGAKNWKDALTPFFRDANICLFQDNDITGADHVNKVAAKLHGVARCVRILQLPDLPPKGDVVDWIAAGGTLAQLCELAETKSAAAVDGPLPLFPPLPDAEPYPVDALGPLSRAAAAIATKVQVPPAMAAQSVLASASLATCAHADVILPFGQARPLSLYFVSVSASGDRKSTADNEALWPVEKRETVLREENIDALREWKIEHAAWSAEKRKIEGGKSDFSQRKSDLTQLGDEPQKPLEPNLISDSPTVEGLAKNWPGMHASLGIFSTEGSMFTAGFGMNEDNRLKTAATLSAVWDGKPIKRIRAGDGVSVLPGRRISVHLMIQPDAAGGFLSNAPLRDQGLLSRILVAKPESLAGTRLYKDSAQKDDAAIKAFGARILSILEAEPALAEGKRNELKPRSLPLSTEAKPAWVAFHDHVETQCGPSGDLVPVRDFAAKAAEHAARIAGVLTIVDDLVATEIGAPAMNNALVLMDWYLNEACRLQQGGLINSALLSAALLLEWLWKQPEQTAAFREILQFGPSRLRTKAAAEEAVAILKSHNWISEVSARPLAFKAVTP